MDGTKNKLDLLRKHLLKNNQMILASDLSSLGIESIYLTRLLRLGEIDRVGRGVYISSNAIKDDMFVLQAQTKRTIFSHTTALYLHKLTTRDPLHYTVTVPSRYHNPSLKKKQVIVFSVKRELWDLGAVYLSTQLGNQIHTYNQERTICDLIRNRSAIDVQLINEGINNYINNSKKNIPLLFNYAKKFQLTNIMQEKLGILL